MHERAQREKIEIALVRESRSGLLMRVSSRCERRRRDRRGGRCARRRNRAAPCVRLAGRRALRYAVVIRQRRAQRRDGNARRHRRLHDVAQRLLSGRERCREAVVEHQIDERRVSAEGGAHVRQQRRADDAARPPDFRDLGEVDVVLVFVRRLPQQRHALRVGDDFRGIERAAQVASITSGPARPPALPSDDGRARAALCWRRHARISSADSSRASTAAFTVGIGAPTSNAFWLIHLPVPFCCASSRMRSTSGLPVSLSTRSSTRAVISTRYERSSPSFHVGKDVRDFAGGHAGGARQHVVDLGDELHVAVLDAVVHHLDVVARTARPHVGHARLAVFGLCRHRAENRRERVPRLARPSGHHRRPSQRAFFAAGHAHADKAEPRRRELICAPIGIAEKRIAAVDEDVFALEVRTKVRDDAVDRRTGRHHHQDAPRPLEHGHQLAPAHRRCRCSSRSTARPRTRAFSPRRGRSPRPEIPCWRCCARDWRPSRRARRLRSCRSSSPGLA